MKINTLLVGLAIGCTLAGLPLKTLGGTGTPLVYYNLDESSGQTAHDGSGYGRNAIATNANPNWQPTSGMIGGCMDFTPAAYTDVSQRFDYGSPGGTNMSNVSFPITIAGWMKTTAAQANIQTSISFCASNNSTEQFFLGVQSSTAGASANDGAALARSNAIMNYCYTPTVINDGNWHHLAVTFINGNSNVMYEDGISVSTNSQLQGTVTFFPVNSIGLGALARFPGGSVANGYNGYLDDVAVWGQQLSPQEIALINGLGRFEQLAVTNSGIDTLVSIYTAQGTGGSASVGTHTWAYASGLVSSPAKIGTTGGSVASGNGYIVLGTAGDGVQMQGVSGPPSVTFGVTPTQVYSGGSGTLSWSVASSSTPTLSISPGVGTVAASGTDPVSPAVTTTYTLTAVNASGTTTKTATLTVITNPVITITAGPPQIYIGQSSQLSWSVTNDASAQINQGIGAIANIGTTNVSPTTTTTYTLIATNSLSQTTATNTVTIAVLPLPPPPQIVLDWQLNEGIGTNVFNSLNTNLYVGTFQDTNEADPVWSYGYLYQNGLAFSPTNYPDENDAVRTSVAGAITNYPYTMAMWATADAQTLGNGQVNTLAVLMSSTVANTTWSLGIEGLNNGNNNYFEIGARSPSLNAQTHYALDLTGSGWHQLVCVFESAYVHRLYIDGQLGVSDVTDYIPFAPSDRFAIGCLDRGPSTGFYNGSLSDVALLSGMWQTNDVANIYGATTGLQIGIADAQSLLTGFQTGPGGTAIAGGAIWNYATGLAGALGSTSGSIAGNNAYIVMDNAGDGMQLVPSAPPIITAEPLSETNYLASTALFAVGVYSTDPVTYQWHFDNTSLTGQTNATLAVTNVQPALAGSYYCSVTNDIGGTNSLVAVLTVLTNATILAFNESQSYIYAADGTPVTLTWSVTNAASISITPGVGAVAMAGSIIVSPTNTTTYTLTATNAYSVATQTLTLGVRTSPPTQVVVNWGMHDGSGTNVSNYASTNFTGHFQTLEAYPAWTAGGFLGDCLAFSPPVANTNDSVVVLASGEAVTNYPFVLSAWVNVTSANVKADLITLFSANANFDRLLLINNSPSMEARVGADDIVTTATPNITGAGWVHVVGSFEDTNTCSLYVNGVLAAQTIGTNPAFLAPIEVSGGALDRAPNVDFYTGLMDEATVLTGRWNSNDVAIIYGGMTGLGLNTAPAETLRAGFKNGSAYVLAQNKAWQRVSGLSGVLGSTGGSLTGNNAYEVMDNAGDGMQVVVGPPIITQQPQSQTNTVGDTVTFVVQAGSSLPETNQWYFAGGPLMGQTNLTLVLANIQPSQAGNYYCKVGNPLGSTNSSTAVLAINAALSANKIQQAVILPNGAFQLVASGTSGYTYTILSSPSLTGPWTTVTNILCGASGQVQFTDPTAPLPAMKFYRTVVNQ